MNQESPDLSVGASICGYLIVCDRRIEQAVERHFIPALAIAGFTTPLLLDPIHNLLSWDGSAYGSFHLL
jgi:hypothetical protein